MSNLTKFFSKVGGEGIYLRAKDFEDSRKVMALPWVHDNKIIHFLPYFEAWQWLDKNKTGPKDKKKPVRVTFDMADDLPVIDFSTSLNSFSGKTTSDSWRAAIAFLFKDLETGEIKVASFTQATLLRGFAKFVNDDEDNDFYDEDWHKKILVIGKETEQKWAVSLLEDKKGVFNKSFGEESFEWSWQQYLDCEEQKDGDSWQDVLDIIGDKPKTNKEKKKAESTDSVDEAKELYETLKTPKGTAINSLHLDELEKLRELLEKNKKPAQKNLLIAVLYGIELKNQETDELQGDDIDF